MFDYYIKSIVNVIFLTNLMTVIALPFIAAIYVLIRFALGGDFPESKFFWQEWR